MSPMSILQSAAVSAGNYGSYFDQMLLMQGQVIDYNYGNSEDIANLSPEPMNAKRKRAMSEPYIKPQSSDGDPKKSSSMRINSSFTTDHISHSLDVGNNGSIHLLSVSELLERYKNVYNTNGRIGIYTRDERDAIIHRFQEKRARRVWRKKVSTVTELPYTLARPCREYKCILIHLIHAPPLSPPLYPNRFMY